MSVIWFTNEFSKEKYSLEIEFCTTTKRAPLIAVFVRFEVIISLLSEILTSISDRCNPHGNSCVN